MTVSEAILTLNANAVNAVIACERAGFNSATVKMIEDALDTIEDALKAQEPNTRRWVKERDRTNHWRCSCCGCVQGITARVYRYCPNCGARMEVCEE